MHNEMRGIKKFFWLIIILLPLLVIPTILSGGEADKKPERNSEIQGNYVLMVKGNFISLKAKDASLRDIIEEIGRRMKIEVVVNIPREEKITIEFDLMYLGDAIKRFKTNYAYITTSEKESSKISKIVAVPESTEKLPSNKFEDNPQSPIQTYNPQPPIQQFEQKSQPSMQELEYNPQPSIQKDEVKERKRRVEPESRARKKVGTEEPSIPESLKEEPSIPESLKEEPSTPESLKEEPSTPESLKFEYNPQPSIQEEK